MFSNNNIRTIFIGTPDFALPSLRALINDEQFEIIAVVTQPDKKVGRKQIITPPPVKVLAEENNIPVFQPNKITNDQIPITNIDLIVVVAYAQIIPESILSMPKYGCINVHGSLLPKYRGAACIQAAILNGDAETGITIMKMDKGLDTGPIIHQETLGIEDNDTAGTLFDKMAGLGGKILAPTLKKYITGELNPVAQDDSQASYVGMLKKENGKIDWTREAEYTERFIRAMSPWPGAFSKIQTAEDENIVFTLKILETVHNPITIAGHKPGELFLYENNLAVQCGKEALIISKLQQEGKKAMDSEEFLRGHKNIIGKVLK